MTKMKRNESFLKRNQPFVKVDGRQSLSGVDTINKTPSVRRLDHTLAALTLFSLSLPHCIGLSTIHRYRPMSMCPPPA